jgi:hypothetical protein
MLAGSVHIREVPAQIGTTGSDNRSASSPENIHVHGAHSFSHVRPRSADRTFIALLDQRSYGQVVRFVAGGKPFTVDLER